MALAGGALPQKPARMFFPQMDVILSLRRIGDGLLRGEGILPLRVAGILPAIRGRPRTEGPLRVPLDTNGQGRDALATPGIAKAYRP